VYREWENFANIALYLETIMRQAHTYYKTLMHPSWRQPAKTHTGLCLFCIYYNSWWGMGITHLCIGFKMPVPQHN